MRDVSFLTEKATMHVQLVGHDPSLDRTYGGFRTDERGERDLADKLQIHLEKSTLQ